MDACVLHWVDVPGRYTTVRHATLELVPLHLLPCSTLYVHVLASRLILPCTRACPDELQPQRHRAAGGAGCADPPQNPGHCQQPHPAAGGPGNAAGAAGGTLLPASDCTQTWLCPFSVRSHRGDGCPSGPLHPSLASISPLDTACFGRPVHRSQPPCPCHPTPPPPPHHAPPRS